MSTNHIFPFQHFTPGYVVPLFLFLEYEQASERNHLNSCSELQQHIPERSISLRSQSNRTLSRFCFVTTLFLLWSNAILRCHSSHFFLLLRIFVWNNIFPVILTDFSSWYLRIMSGCRISVENTFFKHFCLQNSAYTDIWYIRALNPKPPKPLLSTTCVTNVMD